ncbi:MAG: adenylosuccinate lyase [Phycisphaerae bacterium]|nr:adenylosuccinate lyase [Phycisphaerae bacterium]
MSETTPHDGYQSPLETRNASAEMRSLWSARRKFSLWRRLWLALAESERDIGLPIGADQIAEMRGHLDDIDFAAAARHEERLRHDVMAHVHAFGDVAPKAKAIIHLGMTSQDVVCNADVLMLREGLSIIARKVARVIDRLGRFASERRALATLGYTHYQPAQPTTVGKRAALWAQEFAIALEEVEHRRDGLQLKGLRGATGTQASFLGLLDNDASRVDRLEAAFVRRLGELAAWPEARCVPVCGQTYPRIVDAQILSSLAVVASAIHKCCNDLRLLANLKEIEEPFETNQIGSSAMPYKRNPMRCERATGLARFVISMAHNGYDTAATQWLERTLDDSSNRRLSLPEAFLALDGALDIMANVCSGLVVHERMIASHLDAELPFMMSENLMLAAAKAGADRQEAHEAIRVHSQAAAARVKGEAKTNDLLERLAADPHFAGVNLAAICNGLAATGRAAEQVDRFVSDVVAPIRARYASTIADEPTLKV